MTHQGLQGSLSCGSHRGSGICQPRPSVCGWPAAVTPTLFATAPVRLATASVAQLQLRAPTGSSPPSARSTPDPLPLLSPLSLESFEVDPPGAALPA